jgi:DNA repair protein RadC
MTAIMHKRRMRWIPATMVCEVQVQVPLGAMRFPADSARIFMEAHDATDQREHFKVAVLDVRQRVKRIETISVGCLTSSLAHPREVFEVAIRERAAAIILSHNHPSGDPEPSAEDLSLTRRLVSGGQLLGIEVLDHIIIGVERWVSLKERGVL